MGEFVAAASERLDVALAAHVGSRTVAQRLIETGLVTVDGAPRVKRHMLSGGERVAWEPEAILEEAPVAPASFTIVYEDDDLLVVDKPPGVVVHPARGNRQGTLVQALGERVGGGEEEWRQGVVHRLDRDTSGLLVLARTDAAHTALKAMLKRRDVVREYLALVDGRPGARAGTIDAPLGRDRKVRTRMSTETDAPRGAITHFEIEEALPDATLLRVRLQTGRTHQIRAHLLAIGHPVLGDPDYGKPGLGLTRQFLHADRLAFTHPITGADVDLRSPLPADLATALERAR